MGSDVWQQWRRQTSRVDELKEEGDSVVDGRQEPDHSQPSKPLSEIFTQMHVPCEKGKVKGGSCRSAANFPSTMELPSTSFRLHPQ